MADSYVNPHYLADPNDRFEDKKMVIIRPKALNIVWGGDSRYWNIPDDKNKPAELRQVCWLEVTTSTEIKKSDRTKKFEVGFEISFAPDAFGWGIEYPIYFMTKRGKDGRASWKKIVLDASDSRREITREVEKIAESDDIIHWGLYEVWNGKWKGGLRIHKAFAKPL